MFFFTFGLFFTVAGVAQDVCTRNLEQARMQFDNGKFYEVEPLIRGCIISGFSKQERIDALELLALTDLYLDKMKEADSVYLSLLKLDPEHKVNPLIRPPDLVFLHESFRTQPLFNWEITAGFNYTIPTTLSEESLADYHVMNLVDVDVADQAGFEQTVKQQKAYDPQFGFTIGSEIDIRLLRNLYVGTGIHFEELRYKYTSDVFKDLESPDNNFIYKSSYNQVMDWMNIPLFFQYRFKNIRNNPYLRVGGWYNFLIASRKTDLSRQKKADSPVQESQEELRTWADTKMKRRQNFSFEFGAGMMFKTKGIAYIVTEISFMPMIRTENNESNLYGDFESQNNKEKWAASNDYIRLSTYRISLKFMQPFYRPKKLDQ